MFKITLLRPILTVLTWLAHHRNSSSYDQEHASVYGKEHSPDSKYAVMARKVLGILKRHVVLEGCVVLDAGGGTGGFAEKLLEGGVGKMYLFDSSAGMLSVAAARLARFGDRAVMWQANIQDKIHLEDNSVDCALCIQVLHYIENWDYLATELFRVLKDGGCAVIVTVHPAADIVLRGIGTYFEIEKGKAFLTSGGKLWPLTYWRRPLEAMVTPFLSAGLVMVEVAEPSLRSPTSRPWWDITESLYQYFPPYVVLVFRK